MNERSIQRALYWHFRSGAKAVMPNWSPRGWYECDVLVVMKSGFTVEIEIKLSRFDFLADVKKGNKHAQLADELPARWRPTRFFFAFPAGMVRDSEVPEWAGIIHVEVGLNSYPGLWIHRPAPRRKTERFSDRDLKRMYENSYYRMWNRMFELDELSKQPTASGKAAR